MTQSFEDQIKEAIQLRNSGKYSEVIDLLEEILRNEELDQEKKLHSMNLLSYSYSRFGAMFSASDEKIVKGIEIAEEAYKQSKDLENPIFRFDSLQWLFFSYYYKNAWKETYEIIEEAESAFKELRDLPAIQKKEKLVFLKIMQAIKLEIKKEFDAKYKWNYEESIELMKNALELSIELKNEYFQGF
ncbi:MAG: hypothetical protein ACXABJ_09270, partial [Candidatus Heimdallarchaeaceae archaeon]